MRSFVYVLTSLAVMGLAFWAYRENYRTQDELARMSQLQAEIAGLREGLSVLKAEWAYLNRPERLAELANLNFERLALLPMAPEQFGAVSEIAFPATDGLGRGPTVGPDLGGLDLVEVSGQAAGSVATGALGVAPDPAFEEEAAAPVEDAEAETAVAQAPVAEPVAEPKQAPKAKPQKVAQVTAAEKELAKPAAKAAEKPSSAAKTSPRPQARPARKGAAQ